MGLPAGWVTDVPGVPRNAQLKALGNGVVPQQVALALAMLGIGQSDAPESSCGRLLPTPDAAVSNDGEDIDGWVARRERVKARGINGNGMGTPLAIAVRLLDEGETARLRVAEGWASLPGEWAGRA